MLERFGVTFSWQRASIEAISMIAKEADRLGFGYLWVPEAWGLEAFSTIAHVLGLTSRIRVGSGVLNVYSRSAATIGMGCATLDQIAQGRIILGLGSSGKALIEGWHGVRFEKPLERTKEYVEVIRKVCHGETVDFEGETLKVSRYRLFAQPMRSRLEVYLGAIGDRNLELSGSVGDGAILAMYPMGMLSRALDLVNKGGVGTDAKQVFTYYPTHATVSEAELLAARAYTAKYISFYVASMGTYYALNLSRAGFEQDVNAITRAHSVSGSKGASGAVSDGLLGELSLIGPASSILESVSKFPKGVVPVFGLNAGSPEEAETSVNTLRRIASA